MYAKVFRSLFDGSMRGKSDLILVFVNLLCSSDADGIVDRTHKAISDETGLTLDSVQKAILDLEAPDPESRTPAEEGRRIVRLDPNRSWGWRIVNYEKYRDLYCREQNAERQRRFRASRNASVTPPRDGLLRPISVSVSESVSGLQEGDVGGEEPNQPKTRRKPPIPDDEWLKQVQAEYTWADVQAEAVKGRRWCLEHNRTFSRQFFVNWLNKVPKPMSGGDQPPRRTTHADDRRADQAAREYPEPPKELPRL